MNTTDNGTEHVELPRGVIANDRTRIDRCYDCVQRLFRGRVDLVVAEDLADLGQRRTTVQHLGSGGVPQPVRPDRCQLDTIARAADDAGDGLWSRSPCGERLPG